MDGDAQLFQSFVRLGQPRCSPMDYFSKVHTLSVLPSNTIPFPPCSFIGGLIAINLARDPKMNKVAIDAIAIEFQIPNLHAALGDYIQRETLKFPYLVSGLHMSPCDCHLPFMQLAVWHMVHLQPPHFYSSSNLDPAQTITASPPSPSWKHGHFDTVIFNVEPAKVWPHSGLSRSTLSMYIHRFNSSQYDPIMSMHILQRAKRMNGEHFGSVIPLNQLHSTAGLIFSSVANRRLSSTNSCTLSDDFLLNKYWDKEMFFTLYNGSK
ncbi:hypothetical protein V8E55_009524 [Tylopilus felleus]